LDLAHPEWLWLVVPWSLLAAWSARGRRRRGLMWRALGQGGRPPGDGRVGGLAATFLLVVAATQPRWGRDPAAVVPPGRDVVLLIDVSRSMAAEDVVPSRMGVAIESARGLIAAMAGEEGDRAAVVAFAGGGVVRCGLTENRGAAAEVVRGLAPGTVQPGGTDLGAAIEIAAGAFDDRDRADGRMIVVFTDGEDHAGGWRDRLGPLRDAGIVVNAVAIGDPEAAHPVPSGEGGGVLSYRGKPVASRRSDEALDALAAATGGGVVRLGLASADLGALYRERIAPAARRAREATHPPERAERSGAFLFAALMALTLGSRPRPSRRTARRWGVVASAAMMVALGAGPARESPRRLVDRGRAAYGAGRFDEALAAFDAASAAAPSAAIPRYNAAAALFALRRYPEAIARYRRARDLGDPALGVKVDYAMGNAYLMGDDPATAIRHYDACIASTVRSPALASIRRDAEANRDYARKRLEDPAPEPNPGPSRDKTKNDPAPEPARAPPDPGKAEGDDRDGPRGRGGAGGSRPRPEPEKGGRSPQERLDDAIEEVREALARRPPAAPPQSPPTDLKDW